MKKLLALLSLLICGLSNPVYAQLGSPVEPGLNPYVRKNYGVFTGPVQAANYASGSEPTSPAPRPGDFIYDSTNNALSFWNGSTWTDVTGGGAGFAVVPDTNNFVVTADGAGGGIGETNLQFDGSTLAVTGAATISTTLGVTGQATFKATVINNTNQGVYYGTSADSVLIYSSAQTPNTLLAGVSSASNHMMIVQAADRSANYGHVQATTPTLFIHSAAAAGVATDEWLGLTHDGTNGVLSVGSGTLSIPGTLGVTGRITASGGITAPAGGSATSEAYGSGASIAAGKNQSLAVGNIARALNNSGTAIGYDAVAEGSSTAVGANTDAVGSATALGSGAQATGTDSLAAGDGSQATQSDSTALGSGALATGGASNIAIGESATANGAGNAIALGRAAVASIAGSFVVGDDSAPITSMYIGEGILSATPSAFVLNATGGTTGGSSINASTFTIQGGLPSGAGTGGSVIVATTDGVDPGGFLAQSPTTVATFDATAAYEVTVAGDLQAANGNFTNGLNAYVGSTTNVVIGETRPAVGGGDTGNVIVGDDITFTSGDQKTLIGSDIISGAASRNIGIGYGVDVSCGSGQTVIGWNASCVGAGDIVALGEGVACHGDSTCLGNDSDSTASKQLVFGNNSYFTTVKFGKDEDSSPNTNITFKTADPSNNDWGTNDLIWQSQMPTGAASGNTGAVGSIKLNISNGDSGTATGVVHTAITALEISNALGAGAQVPTVTVTADLALTELSGSPANVSGAGQLWTESDNEVHFLDGDGGETRLIKHSDAKFYFNGLATATDIVEADVDHAVGLATMEDIDGGWAFSAGSNTAAGGVTITDVADNGGGEIRCTTSGVHGLTAPTVITITNTSDAGDLPNGVYYVATVSDTTHFDLKGTTYVGTTATSDYGEPSHMTAAAIDAGEYAVIWDLNQSAGGAGGSTYISKVWKCTTAGACTAYATGIRERTTTGTSIGSYGGSLIEKTTAGGDKYFLTIQAGATNVDPTNKYGSLMLMRH